MKDVVCSKVLLTEENTNRLTKENIRALESKETKTSNIINLRKLDTWLNIKKLIRTMNQQAEVSVVAFHVK